MKHHALSSARQDATTRSHAERRARAQLETRKFVPPMQWSGTRPLPAVALVVGAGEQDWPSRHYQQLLSFRDRVASLYRFNRLDERHDLIVLRFSSPIEYSSDLLGPFMPLQWNSDGALTNLECRALVSAQNPARGAAPMAVFWQGRHAMVPIENAVQMDKYILWAPPKIIIHKSRALTLKRRQENGTARALPNVTPVSVSPRTAEMFDDGGSVFADLDAQIKQKASRPDNAITRALLAFWSSKIFTRLLGRARQTRGSGDGQSGHNSTQQQTYRGPTLGQRLRGWLAWNTPYGNNLRSKYMQRMNLVSDMIKRGDVDGALKHALAVAQKHAARQRRKGNVVLPIEVPPPRAALDLEISHDAVANPILGDILHDDLISEYWSLAELLSDRGDYRRAAFVYAKLLGNYENAVLELEKGELYDEAAKLALQARLDPATVIRLYFLAGDHKRALALAERFDSFAVLADYAWQSHPHFYAFVIKSWSDRLAASGQWLSALRVSDRLAKAGLTKSAMAGLHDQRRIWLKEAMHGSADISASLLTYALLYGAWDDGEVDASWDTASRDDSSERGYLAVRQLRSWADEDSADSTQQLNEVLAHLHGNADASRIDQGAFWTNAAKAIIDPFVRHIMARQRNDLSKAKIQMLGQLADHAGLKVLAEDLKKLKRLRVKDKKHEPLIYTVSLSGPARPLVRAGASLSNGRVLLWRESKLLELWDRSGQPVWSTTLSAVGAIIQAGSAAYAIVIQDEKIDSITGKCRRRLLRFDMRNQRLKDLGVFDLRAWHDVTSESQWLVQIGDCVGGLDLGKLLHAHTPKVEFQWRAQVAINLKCIAFYMCPGEHYNWITLDQSERGLGMIEYWSYKSASNAIEVRAYVYDEPQARCDGWLWLRHYHIVNSQRYDDRILGYWSADSYGIESQEWQALKVMAKQLGRWAPQVLSCDLGRVGLAEREATRTDPGPDANIIGTGTIAAETDPRAATYAIELRYDHAQPIVSLMPQEGVELTLIDRSAGKDGQAMFVLQDGGVLIVDRAGRDVRKI